MKKTTLLSFLMCVPILLFATPCSWSGGGCTTSVHQHETHYTMYTSCDDGTSYEWIFDGQHPFPDIVCSNGNQQ